VVALRNSPLDQTLRQLESDARTAQGLARILTSRLIWIDYSQCHRHSLGTGEMMVGDNQVHTQPPGGLPKYFEESVIGGPGAFLFTVENFGSFAEAITRKLVTEIAGTPGGAQTAASR